MKQIFFNFKKYPGAYSEPDEWNWRQNVMFWLLLIAAVLIVSGLAIWVVYGIIFIVQAL